jgi:uncharacterized secreted protein with C-terminal beta-propeller domain
MTRLRARLGVVFAAGLLLAGCTSDPTPPGDRDSNRDPAAPAGPLLRLVAFSSCDDALARLREAAKESVGPYGFPGAYPVMASGIRPAPPGAAVADAAGARAGGGLAEAPAYSGTNTHEAGVDEPDLVKTDGRRIVTVSRGVLRVVDAERRAVVGTLNLGRDNADPIRWSGADLLLHGDRALVLVNGGDFGIMSDGGSSGRPFGPRPIAGSSVLLVDISGTPRLVARHRFDGSLIDARQVGRTARLVMRSMPRLDFPIDKTGNADEADRIATNRRFIDQAGVADWLPRYELTEGGRTTTGRVPCDRLSRPTSYSGASMLSILTFDLSASGLGDGDPLTVIADGDTVYGTGTSLYVASDQRWRFQPWFGDGRLPAQRRNVAPEQTTDLFKFDTTGSGRPRFVAGGSVPGWLINQYAMSEWDGRLRVATTVGQPTWQPDGATGATSPTSQSGVYVLRTDGDRLVEQGRVTGLGRNERIYAVRFIGPVGYVVTFRQTDPLYTLDLGDPARPRVTGELKITGYSAYLHPAGDGRLIGVGQEASDQGRVQGTQVSLFDVSDPARPRRLAQHHVRSSHSEAEFDPHAFLYWPADRLLVLPVSVYGAAAADKPVDRSGLMVLRVEDRGIAEVGMVRTPALARSDRGGQIRRSLIVGDVLWALSDAGLRAVDSTTLDGLAWVAL